MALVKPNSQKTHGPTQPDSVLQSNRTPESRAGWGSDVSSQHGSDLGSIHKEWLRAQVETGCFFSQHGSDLAFHKNWVWVRVGNVRIFFSVLWQWIARSHSTSWLAAPAFNQPSNSYFPSFCLRDSYHMTLVKEVNALAIANIQGAINGCLLSWVLYSLFMQLCLVGIEVVVHQEKGHSKVGGSEKGRLSGGTGPGLGREGGGAEDTL